MNVNPIYESMGESIEKYLFVVPKYQRGYAWTSEEISDFLMDLDTCLINRIDHDSPKEHFLGGIVCVSKTIPGSTSGYVELVDGQQRIATCILFIKNILDQYKKINELVENSDIQKKELLSDSIINIKKYLFQKIKINLQYQDRDRLVLSDVDSLYFKNHLQGIPSPAERESHKLIQSAASSIQNWMHSKLSDLSLDDKISFLDTLETILLKDFTIILIITETNSEAYKLFQVLNDRGIGLTESDLLRAKSLELLESTDPNIKQIQSNVEKMWDSILKDGRKLVNENMIDYFTAKLGRKPKKTSILDEYVDNLFPELRDISISINTQNAELFSNKIKELHDSVILLNKIKDGEYPFENTDGILNWDKELLRILIKELNHDLCVPLLLSLAKTNKEKFKEAVKICLILFFRAKIICKVHAGSISKIYYELSKNLYEDNNYDIINNLKNKSRLLISRKAQDDNFKENLYSELVYNQNKGNKSLRFFLIYSEYYFTSFVENGIIRPNKERVIDFSTVNIEHIYPQNIANNPDQQLEEVKNSIGNIVCYSEIRNEQDKNKLFEDKIQDYAQSDFAIAKWISQNYLKWELDDFSSLKQKFEELSLLIYKV